jgi:hypothetical protein
MAKKLDPHLLEILTTYGEKPEDALWDCHGTWVAYHKAIERIAAKASIVFDMPQIIEARSADKTVAIAVRGTMKDRAEWSFGEAAPANNKNAYPYAMAEKRAKDRVVLKLIGLHGLVYSEEESDDFKAKQSASSREEEYQPPQGWERSPEDPPAKSSAQLKRDGFWPDFIRELDECGTLLMLEKFKTAWREKARSDGWTAAWKSAAKDRIAGRELAIMNEMDAAELAEVPLKEALSRSLGADDERNEYWDTFVP